ncbi:serine/threonine protein kinase [Corallococcus carmarthensis]|uniref:Serine/threonine protein kinase n=2 Tax=Corallococcus carmarthensis TaxID=2316728 RepID=A0A3A8JWJ5_9BACT|nr:protein kinase [Corallococcus carmarthensis]RKH00090.1 serine/threonine protein kinase [Corallococcus carmarthensis]
MSTQGGAGEDPDRGRRIGKYEILTRLSMGGMAELFLAFTSGPGGFRKFVAVKQILPDIKKDDQFVKMFLDEARITAAFSHANIGQVFDLGEEDGELYLAMEFLPGQNLEQVVKMAERRKYALPLGFTARVIRDTCLGLHYAHHFMDPSGRPVAVVHRDVSPKNVMLTYDGVVKVIDFGIAKARGKLGRTQVGTVKGTSGYMSPEQVRNRDLDGRSDQFSTGVMLHELLAGQRLFNAPGEAAVMMQIVDGEIPAPRSLNPAVPEAMEAVVLKSLSRDAAQRFGTCREMARAIEATLGAELFDEDQMTAVMGELFEEKRQKTRTLLELASRAEDARVSEAAGALQAEEGTDQAAAAATAQVKSPHADAPPPDVAASFKPTPVRRPAAESATPAPRATPRPATEPAEARASRVNTPTVTPRAARPAASDAAPIPRVIRPPADAVRPSRARPIARPEPAEARGAPQDDGLMDPPSDLQTQRFRARPARNSARPSQQAEEEVAEAPPVAKPAREGSGWGMRLFLLLILGGVGYLLTLAPVRRVFMPAVDSVKQWVKAELDPAPPVDPAANGQWPPKPSGPPPGFAQKTTPEPEKAPEVETPPPLPPEPVVDATPVDPKKTPAGKGGRKPKPAPSAPAATTEKPTVAKVDPRPAKPEPSVRPPEPVTTVTQAENPEVLDTTTAKGAAKAGLGWLTLYTVPKNAAVFDGATQLGTSPLTKFPLPVGTYRLRVVDPQDPGGTSKLLSAPIRPGEVTKLQIRLADLPAYSD